MRNDLQVSILGVYISNFSQTEAIAMIEDLIWKRCETNAIFIVNAHTLNLATEDPQYREVLNTATEVLADGTGIRWAARLRGVKLKDNLVGTDLIPRLFEVTAFRGYRYYLLGAHSDTIERAAHTVSKKYPGWNLVGFHHGYIAPNDTNEVIKKINAVNPDLLLVGMGNPWQEYWIREHQATLRVPVCIGVGGLFNHWSGDLIRAPLWVRRQGFEWLQILLQQPYKWRRYLVGNPKFLLRIVQQLPRDRLLSVQR
jgi:N-acetylglucosaminyldiphosphoundecaprenol N-acetyl-beta-D-mannosaminyltransferase